MPLPPKGFVNTLQIMDPLLSVRWGDYVRKWVVERTAVTPIHELKWMIARRERESVDIRAGLASKDDELDFAGLNEEIASLQAGRRVIVFAEQLTQQVFNDLCLSDIQRYGGYVRYTDSRIEKKDAKRAAARKARNARNHDANVEMFGSQNSRGLYDFLTDKNRAGAVDQLHRGEKTLRQVLGITDSAPILGRGGDVKLVTA